MKSDQSPRDKISEEKQLRSKAILYAALYTVFALLFVVLRAYGVVDELPLKLGFFEFLFGK